jgi:glycosyltransferase involved in cell wall biosynthesis
VAELGVQDEVSFSGFINQSELPRVCAASDLFVLPSEQEPWGLIVNEVMCAGLPVVVAEEVGCVPDLVHDGRNGLLVRAGDVESLTDALRRLVRGHAERAEMGRQSLEVIRPWSYERCRTGLMAAIYTQPFT